MLTLSDLQNTGGASVACNRIANALSNCGVTVSSTSSDGFESSSHKPLLLGRKYQVLSTLFSSKLPNFILENLRFKELQKQLRSLLRAKRPDVINAHNLHSAGWPVSLIRTCLDYAPVVWTLHDCWSFLGSFYPTHSPTPSAKLKDEIDRFWNSLRVNPPKYKICGITPSAWMKKHANDYQWKDYQVEVIHNPMPDSFFISKDRTACKRALNLKEGKTTILCIAGNLDEVRKGGLILNDILREQFDDKVEFLLIGRVNSSIISSDNVKCLGFINDEITTQIAYYAADILLHLAPIDNLPNTVAESISCGTPVLAFDTGGISEMVVPEKSGWLVKPICSKLLKTKLKSILENPNKIERLRIGTKAKARIILDSKYIGAQYYHILRSLL